MNSTEILPNQTQPTGIIGNHMKSQTKKYETKMKELSQWDSEQSSTSHRLWQPGGVYGSSIDTEKSEKLPNNYCYFDINTKILNIKLVYKLLRIFRM